MTVPQFDRRHDRNLSCPACYARGMTHFYQALNIPTSSNLLMPTREQALTCPRGDLRLAHCAACGFITNTSFDPETQQLTALYEATQACSQTFGGFARQLAQSWIDRYSLRGRKLLEIGCGKGEFLAMICDLADAPGWGIDPIADPASSGGRIRLLAEKFGAHHGDIAPDFIFCRHTLEHIPDVLAFCRSIREAIGQRQHVVLAIEVPDTRRVLLNGAFWDLYYEHCSYFDTESLAGLLARCGFEVMQARIEYAGQYLVIEARPTAHDPTKSAASPALDHQPKQSFTLPDTSRCAEQIELWRHTLLDRPDGSVVIWGAGSKAVGFLTTLGITGQVAAVVDINPAKQGTFLPGTGHEIIPPHRLRELRPDVVLVMNAIYTDEIRRSLGEMALSPTILTLD